jgi:GT2 family glycosyltransferase
VRNFLGCNMSFRREAFATVGGFNHQVGRIGRRPLGCEETEFCIRLTRAEPESVLIYDPAAAVKHYVSQDRRRFSYFRERCYSEGLSKAMVVKLVGGNQGLANERSYLLRVLPRGLVTGLLRSPLRPSGIGRAGAIVAGAAATAVGYLRARYQLGSSRPSELKRSRKSSVVS